MGCARIYCDQTLILGVHPLSMGQGSKVLPYVCSGLRRFGVLAVNHLVGGSSPSRGAKLNKELRPFNSPGLKLLYQICTSALHHPGAREPFCILGEMIGRKVRVASNHTRTFPTAQLLQHIQRRPGLHVP